MAAAFTTTQLAEEAQCCSAMTLLFISSLEKNKHTNKRGQDRKDWTRPDCSEPDQTGTDRNKLVQNGLDWTGEDQTIPV